MLVPFRWAPTVHQGILRPKTARTASAILIPGSTYNFQPSWPLSQSQPFRIWPVVGRQRRAAEGVVVEIDEDLLDDEVHYLRTDIYSWDEAEPLTVRLTAHDRFRP